MFLYERSGALKYFLGFMAGRSEKGTYLCQWKYAIDKSVGNQASKFSYEKIHKLGKAKGGLISQPDIYIHDWWGV